MILILKKKMQILWGLALYFLITCIGTEPEKARQDVTDYKLELKISVHALKFWNSDFDLEFRIFTDFKISILNYKFSF